MHAQVRRGQFLISTDPGLIDLDLVHGLLRTAYWCRDIPRQTVLRGIEHSLTFGVYDTGVPLDEAMADGPAAPAHDPTATVRQVGFARVITDRATFAYLADVFIVDAYRGRGLSAWLVQTILAHPDLQGLRRFCLLTRDAHGLYAKFGFKPMPDASRYMERWDPEVYSRAAGAAPR